MTVNCEKYGVGLFAGQTDVRRPKISFLDCCARAAQASLSFLAFECLRSGVYGFMDGMNWNLKASTPRWII